MLFTFSMIFSVSCHIPGPTVSLSHFPRFTIFLAIFQVMPCAFLIFHVFQVSLHTPGSTVCISHFPSFSVFLPTFPVLQCVSHFSRISNSSANFRSYNVHFSFSMFFRFLAIFHFLQCAFLIFHLLKVFCHIPRPTVCISHSPCYSVFLNFFHVIQCFYLISMFFQYFLP